MAPGGYTKYLDKNALKGARIGVLRDVMGPGSDPQSEDFKKVAAVFEKNLGRKQRARRMTRLIRPQVVAGQAGSNSDMTDAALRLYRPEFQFRSRQDISDSDPPSIPPPRRSVLSLWHRPTGQDTASTFRPGSSGINSRTRWPPTSWTPSSTTVEYRRADCGGSIPVQGQHQLHCHIEYLLVFSSILCRRGSRLTIFRWGSRSSARRTASPR